MAGVRDVAEYILSKRDSMTAIKLQKLCYYSQAWHLVWEERPLFAERIEAWANGPVAPDLYRAHRGRFTVVSGDIGGAPEMLNANEAETIDEVLAFYGQMTAHQLSEQTHREAPWRDARAAAGLQPMERGNVEITYAAMIEYYDSLTDADSN